MADVTDTTFNFEKTDFTATTPNIAPSYVGPFSTVMNLLNTLMGAGVLGIANTFTFCGFIPSFLLLLFIAILSYVATVMVVTLQHRLHAESFEFLASRTLGKWGSGIYSVSATLFCISALVVFIIISSSTIQSWFELMHIKIENGSWWYKLLVLVYSLLIPVALTIPKNMHFLSYFSTFSIVCLFLFVVVVIVKGIQILPRDGISPSVIEGDINLGFFNALAIYSLTFTLAVVVIPVIRAAEPNLNKRNIVVGVTFFLCFLCVYVPGVIGYMIFGADVKPVLLESFDQKDPLTIIVRAAFFVVVNASYPVVSLTVGGSFSRFLFGVDNAAHLNGWRRATCLFCVSVIPVVVAMFLPNIRPALSIGGSLGGCLGNFIFPPLIWISASRYRWTHWTNLLCIAFALFGVISACVSTYQSVLDAIKEFSKPSQ